MTRPVVATVAEEAYSALGPLTAKDEDNDWALLNFVAALTLALEEIDDLVRDSDDGPGWSSVVDIDRAPTDALAWLGQLVGVSPDASLDDTAQRERIRDVSGFRRGSRAAMEAAARRYLTGTRTVNIRERDSSAYHLTVTTYAGETPDEDKTEAAIRAQKPAGLVLVYVVSSGASYGTLEATGMTYRQLRATYPTYEHMKLAII
jgi:hypothetical protein